MLLQILEDGRLTDSRGRTVDFRNAIIVMTSNVGSAAIFEQSARNPERARQQALDALRAMFRPEFLNRVDDIVLFNPLGEEHLKQIVRLQLACVAAMLEERKVTFEFTPSAHELLFREGYDDAYGARPLKRAIQRLIQDPLSMRILEGEVSPGDHIIVDADSRAGVMRFTRASARQGAAAD